MPRSGATPMKHARAILEAHFPVVQAAGKRITWIERNGERWPISRGEDIFGCLDFLAVRPRLLCGVQVTTQTAKRSSVPQRKRKIEEYLVVPCEAHIPFPVEIWAWVDRSGFRSWCWRGAWGWVERPGLIASPLLKRPRGNPTLANPFVEAI